MHDFRCTSSVDMFYPLLAKQVKYFKETEGGRSVMCKEVEMLVEKRAEEMLKERAFEEKKAMIKKMIDDNIFSIEQAAKYFELPIDTVKEMADK